MDDVFGFGVKTPAAGIDMCSVKKAIAIVFGCGQIKKDHWQLPMITVLFSNNTWAVDNEYMRPHWIEKLHEEQLFSVKRYADEYDYLQAGRVITDHYKKLYDDELEAKQAKRLANRKETL